MRSPLPLGPAFGVFLRGVHRQQVEAQNVDSAPPKALRRHSRCRRADCSVSRWRNVFTVQKAASTGLGKRKSSMSASKTLAREPCRASRRADNRAGGVQIEAGHLVSPAGQFNHEPAGAAGGSEVALPEKGNTCGKPPRRNRPRDAYPSERRVIEPRIVVPIVLNRLWASHVVFLPRVRRHLPGFGPSYSQWNENGPQESRDSSPTTLCARSMSELGFLEAAWFTLSLQKRGKVDGGKNALRGKAFRKFPRSEACPP